MTSTPLPSALMARKRQGFRIHAIVFAAVMIFLALLNWWIAPPYWVQWVFLGWGIGLLGHYWLAIGRRRTSSHSRPA